MFDRSKCDGVIVEKVVLFRGLATKNFKNPSIITTSGN
jgi:hypothetical protein